MRGNVSASFTVEASVIIPLILFIVVFGIRVALEQYGEVKAEAQKHTALESVEPVRVMWDINKIWEGIKDED